MWDMRPRFQRWLVSSNLTSPQREILIDQTILYSYIVVMDFWDEVDILCKADIVSIWNNEKELKLLLHILKKHINHRRHIYWIENAYPPGRRPQTRYASFTKEFDRMNNIYAAVHDRLRSMNIIMPIIHDYSRDYPLETMNDWVKKIRYNTSIY